MQQELEQIVAVGAVVAATIPFGLSLASFLSYVNSYRDTKMYFSHTDLTRQQALGKPEFLKILGEDFKNMKTVFGGKFNHSYSMRYFSAYLESTRERENSKFLGYRKIREEI